MMNEEDVMSEWYWVSYEINNGGRRDTVVEITAPLNKRDLPAYLKQAVHPDQPGDPTDGLKGQRSMDCTLLNFIKL